MGPVDPGDEIDDRRESGIARRTSSATAVGTGPAPAPASSGVRETLGTPRSVTGLTPQKPGR